ncbi:hypothetical protein [Methylobacillus flagellatus]|uniref:hypothetical protein n=1 Tax=Methylobacillus flagellatus TaxID=405 RepID=UPI0010FA4097|nr:hypothetical protein [Methylobacillus flagellatus]
MRNLITYTFCILLFHTSISFAEETSRKVAYLVVCDDETVIKTLSEKIDERMKQAKFEVTENLPQLKLIVYAQHDINDRVNANGWSFAIAHVTNYPTYFVAAKLLKSESAEAKAVGPVISNMLQYDGFLTYINVAHVDKFDEKTIAILLDNIVGEFAKRVNIQ